MNMSMSEKTNETKKKAPRRPNMRSWEADKDVAKMLDDAERLGAVKKEIINKALRKYGPAALREELKRMRQELDEIERRNTGANNN